MTRRRIPARRPRRSPRENGSRTRAQPRGTRRDDTGWGDVDRNLFDTLRSWRREEAQERGVPPYVIFSDRTLRELARLRPTTLTALRQVYGVGDAKLEQFGRKVIELMGG